MGRYSLTDIYHRENREKRNLRARDWHRNNPVKSLLPTIKSRAKKQGVPFDLTEEDILIPDMCPVLGIPLSKRGGKRTDNTPSVDRIVPSLGYVKGNIKIISWRANRLKCDATLEELEKLVRYMKKTKISKHDLVKINQERKRLDNR